MKKIFNGEPFGVLTHHDLDGAGCAMLLKHCLYGQIIKIQTTGYSKIDKNSLKIKSENIFITDISLNQEQIDFINENFTNIILIDHHESSLQQTYPEHWDVNLSMKYCGTLLTYMYLKHKGYKEILTGCEEFVKSVNDFDLWILDRKDSIPLNDIFWILKFFPFMSNFQNFSWSPENWKKAKEFQAVKRAEIASFDNYLIEDVLRVVVCNKHISDISLFYTKEDYHVIIRNKGCLSFRSQKVELVEFYNKLNEFGISGGGHKLAGGCELKGTEYEGDEMFVIEQFYNFIKDNT